MGTRPQPRLFQRPLQEFEVRLHRHRHRVGTLPAVNLRVKRRCDSRLEGRGRRIAAVRVHEPEGLDERARAESPPDAPAGEAACGSETGENP